MTTVTESVAGSRRARHGWAVFRRVTAFNEMSILEREQVDWRIVDPHEASRAHHRHLRIGGLPGTHAAHDDRSVAFSGCRLRSRPPRPLGDHLGNR